MTQLHEQFPQSTELSVPRLIISDIGTVAFLGASTAVATLQTVKHFVYEHLPDPTYAVHEFVDRWTGRGLGLALLGTVTYLGAHTYRTLYEDDKGMRHRVLALKFGSQTPPTLESNDLI